MSLPVAILAGGLATRLGAVARHIPKSLVEVAGQPFVVRQIKLLQRHGLTDVLLLVGHRGTQICAAIGDGSRWGVRVRYCFDGPVPLGTGGAIRAALPRLGERFLVLYGDSYLECDYAAIARAFLRCGKPGLMTLCQNDHRWGASNVLFENGRILEYDKHVPRPGMRHIDYGLGAFDTSAFSAWTPGQAFDLSSVYRDLIARGDLAAVVVPGRFFEVGSPAGLDETRALLAGKELAAG